MPCYAIPCHAKPGPMPTHGYAKPANKQDKNTLSSTQLQHKKIARQATHPDSSARVTSMVQKFKLKFVFITHGCLYIRHYARKLGGGTRAKRWSDRITTGRRASKRVPLLSIWSKHRTRDGPVRQTMSTQHTYTNI